MELDKIKVAVKSIEMSKAMEIRMKTNCSNIEKEKPRQFNIKKWGSVACALGVLLLIMIGMPFFNKYGDLQATNFTITAYADSNNGDQLIANLSSEKVTFELSMEDRMGVLNSVGGDGANLIFADVRLNITGEDIDSITYTMNKGKFIEDVTLTAEEVANKDKLLLEKIYIIYSASNSNIYQGIKEIGNTYTVKYSEQDKNEYTLAIPHDGWVVEDNVIINAIVKYTNGNAEQQDIIVTQESDSISLVLH